MVSSLNKSLPEDLTSRQRVLIFKDSIADAAVNLESGAAATLVETYEIESAGSHAIPCYVYFGSLTICGARVISSWDSANARAIYLGDGTSSVLRLMSCILIARHSGSLSLGAASGNTRVHFLNSVMLSRNWQNIDCYPVAPAGPYNDIP